MMFERLRRRLRRSPKQRSNEDWVRELSRSDARAIADLRAELLRGVRVVLRRRAPARAQQLAEDFVHDAVLKILRNLDSFRGDSRFTTWAHKITVRVAFTELRRKRWKDVSLDDMTASSAGGFDDERPAADMVVARKDARHRLHAIMQSDLTEKQRIAIEAVMLHGMPIEEVAGRLDSNRNALYKLLHDARKRLKSSFEERGLTLEEMLAE